MVHMAQTRRAHRKSRSGCAECKRRRIKCDEQHPQCSQCVRYDKTCIYRPTNPARSSSPQSTYSPRGSDSSLQSVQSGSQCTDLVLHLDASGADSLSSHFNLRDLALLHHWSQVTSISIISTPKLNYYWQTLIPQVAFRHGYVMHSLLSLTALHVAYLNPSERSSSLMDAAQHHVKALKGFTDDLNRIGPENSDALFVNAALTFFYAFVAFGRDVGDAGGTARTSRVLGTDWIPMVRGLEAVLRQVYDHVSVGPLKTMLSLGNWEGLDLDTTFDHHDEQVVGIREIWKEGDNAGVYNETLDLLRRCRMWIAQFEVLQIDDESEWGYNRAWSGPFMWLFFSPQKYFDLLEQRQPPALVIFAWFGASIHSLNRYWWIEGCGQSIVDVVEECLGSFWAPWTKWPKEIVRPS